MNNKLKLSENQNKIKDTLLNERCEEIIKLNDESKTIDLFIKDLF